MSQPLLTLNKKKGGFIMKYYTIHFEAETGECFDSFVFNTPEEARSNKAFDNPGYGMLSIKEVDHDEALDIIKSLIDMRVAVENKETEEAWNHEAKEYIRNCEPGWLILEPYLYSKCGYCSTIDDTCPYMGRETKPCCDPNGMCSEEETIRERKEEEQLNTSEDCVEEGVEMLKDVMRNAWQEYDEKMRKGDDAELDVSFFMAQECLEGLGIKFDPKN